MKITVEISPEELKVMRELAVQNFVKLNPTVHIEINGEPKQNDIETIIKNIAKRLGEEIAASTKVLCEEKEENRYVGTVKMDGEKILKALNEANDVLEQLAK